jgi:hypothetical protein
MACKVYEEFCDAAGDGRLHLDTGALKFEFFCQCLAGSACAHWDAIVDTLPDDTNNSLDDGIAEWFTKYFEPNAFHDQKQYFLQATKAYSMSFKETATRVEEIMRFMQFMPGYAAGTPVYTDTEKKMTLYRLMRPNWHTNLMPLETILLMLVTPGLTSFLTSPLKSVENNKPRLVVVLLDVVDAVVLDVVDMELFNALLIKVDSRKVVASVPMDMDTTVKAGLQLPTETATAIMVVDLATVMIMVVVASMVVASRAVAISLLVVAELMVLEPVVVLALVVAVVDVAVVVLLLVLLPLLIPVVVTLVAMVWLTWLMVERSTTSRVSILLPILRATTIPMRKRAISKSTMKKRLSSRMITTISTT